MLAAYSQLFLAACTHSRLTAALRRRKVHCGGRSRGASLALAPMALARIVALKSQCITLCGILPHSFTTLTCPALPHVT